MIDVVDDWIYSKKLKSTTMKTDAEIVAEADLQRIYDILAA